MENIHLFTGENSFELMREKRRWITEFQKKYGEENCSLIDGSSTTVRKLMDEVSVMPFLSEKRLIIVQEFPKSTKEEVQILAQSIHPANILLFVDAKPDKRSAGTKELLKIAKVHTYDPLKGPAVQSWIQSYARELGVAIEPAAIRLLLEYTGDDQSMLAREIEKLSTYVSNATIDTQSVERLSVPTDEGVVWKISDLLSSGSKNDALRYAHKLIDRGGDVYGLWAILSSMLKNLVAVHAVFDAGITNQSDIAEQTGIHPFAVRSLAQYSRRVTPEKMRRIVQWAASSDRALKTGGIRGTDDAPEEMESLIDSFIIQCP